MVAGAGKTSQLLKREAVLAKVLAEVNTPAAPPLTLVCETMGIGRSAVLSAVADELIRRNVTTLSSRVSHTERTRPFALADRLAMALGAPFDDSGASVVSRLAGVLTANRSADRTLEVLLDDLQWIDSDSLGALVSLLPLLANTSMKVVGTVRLPWPDAAGSNAMRQLREAGLVTVLRLRALSQQAINTLVTPSCGPACPSTWRTPRGDPAGVRPARCTPR